MNGKNQRERRDSCRICGNKKLFKFLDLGMHPPSDAFLTKEQLSQPEKTYPLDVYYCDNCGLAQLGYVVPKEELFNDSYPYTTGTNKAGVEHFAELAQTVSEEVKLDDYSFIVDIGSNNGTLLKQFDKVRPLLQIHGFEPVKPIAQMARENHVPTTAEFWGLKSASDVFGYLRKKAKIITATNVFAHVDNLHDFMSGVDLLLDKDGIFVIEAPGFLDLLIMLEYDTIYHEHLSYLSGYPIENLCRQFDMYIDKIDYHNIHGGTYRYYIRKGSIEDELSELGILPIIETFEKKVESHREKLTSLLHSLKSDNKRIVGISAPAKGNTLLNYCKIGTGILDCITEKSDLKIGKFTPGMHIPVMPDSKLIEDQPDYGLILAWNFKDSIMKAVRKLGYKGKFIIPIPEPEVIS